MHEKAVIKYCLCDACLSLITLKYLYRYMAIYFCFLDILGSCVKITLLVLPVIAFSSSSFYFLFLFQLL